MNFYEKKLVHKILVLFVCFYTTHICVAMNPNGDGLPGCIDEKRSHTYVPVTVKEPYNHTWVIMLEHDPSGALVSKKASFVGGVCNYFLDRLFNYFKRKAVTEIDAQGLDLSSGIPDLHDFSMLKKLDLSCTNVTTEMPGWKTLPTTLVELGLHFFQHNWVKIPQWNAPIYQLPDISHLTNLKVLCLSQNGLLSTTVGWNCLPVSLEELYLQGCRLLTKLPSSFKNLKQLRVLNLRETGIEENFKSKYTEEEQEEALKVFRHAENSKNMDALHVQALLAALDKYGLISEEVNS